MKLIEINRRYYHVPESWNELSGDQLLQVVQLFESTKYSIEKAKLKLLKILTGMNWWQFFTAPVTTTERLTFTHTMMQLSLGEYLFMAKQTCTGLEEYLYLGDFLLTKNELTRQLIPEYKEFYGPADEMNNLKMCEFVFSEHYYQEWAALRHKEERTQDDSKSEEKLLNNLIAVLYRPAKPRYHFRRNEDGDCRIAFNENLCEYLADSQIYAWPMHVKLAIVHFYEACREKWVNDNPDVFGGAGEPAKYGLISVMRGVAKGGVHGDLEKVEQKYVSLIMIELNEQVAEAREMKNQMPK